MASVLSFHLLILAILLTLLQEIKFVTASVTVYYQPGQTPLGTATGTASVAAYTGAAAYDPTILTPPAVPNPFNTQFNIQLQNGGTPGVSIQQSGSFMGFSIEMSVANQVVGKNSTLLMVPFLNLMSNIVERAGSVMVRIGGNTQETATLVQSTPDGRILEKDQQGTFNPTNTPPIVYTPDLLQMMRNVSSMTNVRWFLGVPFFNITPPQLAIVEYGQAILGDFLIGLQASNEPDLYVAHGHRPSTYGPYDYFGEFGVMVQAVNADANIPNKALLIGPNLATGWTPQQVWDTGFIDSYTSSLAYLAFERYPADNCGAQYGLGNAVVPQDEFPAYLTHQSPQQLCQYYTNSTLLAQQKGKKLLMFETNTASCGGFPGISDSFGAGLWGLDYALQMAYSNFSGAMFHVGGQNVYYNPFTPPPTNQSTYHQWTIGPIYYSALIMSEVLGATNTSQVLDLSANTANPFTPAYAIYENGTPARVALFNYVTDPSGNSAITASIAIGGGQTGQPNGTPAQVKVKYFAASSVAQKYNFTWAGQTFGDVFESDGRLMGNLDVQTVQCDQTNNVCQIKVPAPGFALVFLNDNDQPASGAGPTTTFSTSSLTNTLNTVSVDPNVLATSNGHSGMDGQSLGSTSSGSVSAAEGGKVRWAGVGVLLSAMISGAMVLGRVIVW